MRNVSLLLLLIFYVIFDAHAQQLSDPPNKDWHLDDVVNAFYNSNNNAQNKPLSDLTKMAAGEFDKLCHQVEGVLRQLTSNSPFKMTRLDPPAINKDCNCYCMCPHDTVNSKVIEDFKVKVNDLKQRFLNVGRSIKQKIHELTSS